MLATEDGLLQTTQQIQSCVITRSRRGRFSCHSCRSHGLPIHEHENEVQTGGLRKSTNGIFQGQWMVRNNKLTLRRNTYLHLLIVSQKETRVLLSIFSMTRPDGFVIVFECVAYLWWCKIDSVFNLQEERKIRNTLNYKNFYEWKWKSESNFQQQNRGFCF